jgi:hypothetical protein
VADPSRKSIYFLSSRVLFHRHTLMRYTDRTEGSPLGIYSSRGTRRRPLYCDLSIHHPQLHRGAFLCYYVNSMHVPVIGF